MERSNEFLIPERVSEIYKIDAYTVSHALITAGFSFIVPPPVGPILSSLFGTIAFNQTISQNMNQLLTDIILDLQELQIRGQIDIQQLFNDPAFTSHLLYAIQIAMRNYKREHHEALRNAIVNSALDNPPEEDIRKMFFNFIDSSTTIHFKLLKFFYEVPKTEEWIEDLRSNFSHESFLENGESTIDDKDAKNFSFDLKDVIKYEFPESDSYETLYLQVTTVLGS